MSAPMSRPSSRRLEHTPQSFAQLSRFLRDGLVHEETAQLRRALGVLSERIEAATHARRSGQGLEEVQRRATALERCARQHQLQLTGMGSAWHALYEFGAYQRGLRQLRDAIALWQDALQRRSVAEAEHFGAFERQAWRTLGEALLVLDMYEQGAGDSGLSHPSAQARSRSDSFPGAPSTSPRAPGRAPLLARLRRWWRGLSRRGRV